MTENNFHSKANILVVDDEPTSQLILQNYLESEGHFVDIAGNAEEMNRFLIETHYALILLDLYLPDGDGIDLLQSIQSNQPNVPIVIITAHGSVERVVQAMRTGAYDFVTKPIDFTRLSAIVKNSIERINLKRKAESYEKTRRRSLCEIVGSSPEMQVVYHIIETVAPTNASIMVTGESGTGKELIAKAIHELSDRREKLLVDVNCAAIPKDLLESELFGHEKSAFTGANQKSVGRCELADGGTLFLDEIAEMDMNLQPKLLRFLQERFLYRVGGKNRIEVDTRVVSATNRDPLNAIKDGYLREDLYYRLNVVHIQLPPLRNRAEDIPELAKMFLERYSSENGKHFESISNEVEDALIQYNWPGNIRELQNTIHQAVVLNDGQVLEINMIPEHMGGVSAKVNFASIANLPNDSTKKSNDKITENLKEKDELIVEVTNSNEIIPLEELEKKAINNALRITEGNVSKAASALQVSQATLYRKIRDFGFVPKDYK